MLSRLTPLYHYVHAVYEDHKQDLLKMTNNTSRRDFLFCIFEEDFNSLSIHKRTLYKTLITGITNAV